MARTLDARILAKVDAARELLREAAELDRRREWHTGRDALATARTKLDIAGDWMARQARENDPTCCLCGGGLGRADTGARRGDGRRMHADASCVPATTDLLEARERIAAVELRAVCSCDAVRLRAPFHAWACAVAVEDRARRGIEARPTRGSFSVPRR